jgi:phosphopentomutase
MALMREGDLMVLTADHGNDPTWKGTDHTRECTPVLSFAKGMKPGSFGHRKTFADIGQTIASHLGIPPLGTGKSWLL